MDTHVYTCVLRESTGMGAGDIVTTVPRASTARKNKLFQARLVAPTVPRARTAEHARVLAPPVTRASTA